MRRDNLFLLVSVLLVSSILLMGCKSTEPAASIDLKDVENEVIMPNEMPSDFNFSLKYGIGALNEINTFKDTYTKDLVEDGTLTIDLKLSKKELHQIYQEMKRVELLSTIQNISYIGEDGNSISSPSHSEGYYLVIQLNGESYHAYWVSEIVDEEIRNKLAIFVYQFLHVEILEKQKEYKKLPEANGWYA